MPWVKIDDGFFDNVTNRELGATGRDLFLAGLCYCAKGLTDGAIPKHDLPLILAQAQAKKSTVEKLVKAGRWIDHGDHLEVDQYLVYQFSRARVEADRAKERDKKRRQRGATDRADDGRFTPRESPGGQSSMSPPGHGAASPLGVPPGRPSVPDPTRPPLLDTSSGSTRYPDDAHTPGGVAVDLERHPKPKLTPERSAELAAEARAARAALHPQEHPAP